MLEPVSLAESKSTDVLFCFVGHVCVVGCRVSREFDSYRSTTGSTLPVVLRYQWFYSTSGSRGVIDVQLDLCRETSCVQRVVRSCFICIFYTCVDVVCK